MNPENDKEEWIEVEAEVMHEEPFPTFGGPPQPMSPTTKVQLFKMVLSMPGGLQRIAESIQGSSDPDLALKNCHMIIDMIEEDARQEIRRAQANLDKSDARLMKMELAKVMAPGLRCDRTDYGKDGR